MPQDLGLLTESDVEQKFVWQLLTNSEPDGLGFSPSEVHTKLSLRRLKIDKGSSARNYFPDYLVLLGGMPVAVVEAKAPSESAIDGYREARLYAAEVNALYKSDVNPCTSVVATNGRELLAGIWDSDDHVSMSCADVASTNAMFDKLRTLVSRSVLVEGATALRKKLGAVERWRPVSELGGQSVRNEEVGHNTFGATLALDYRHLFNPISQADRIHIAKHAYVHSKERDRYVEPIHRLIRHTLPGLSHIKTIGDTGVPKELTSALRKGRSLENQVMLLVGSVGSGKTTFVDHLAHVALPPETQRKTLWTRLDMNAAPLDVGLIYGWVTEQIIQQLQETRPDLDFDSVDTDQKLYAPELRALKKGPLALLEEDSSEYRTRLVDEILALRRDRQKTSAALVRFLCGAESRLLVVVFDNSDKRVRDEQLLLFQVAQWIQRQLRCLVLLPIRDVTYELYRNEPPLDTALLDLVFRIEPPMFSKVLERRINLALLEMKSQAPKSLSYTLPNGMRVEYPASDQGIYLAAILRSLHEHNRFVRRVVTGLAGRDVRKAMEIFLEFCSSGHIGEDDIFKIRQKQGAYSLPFFVVARVLLRMNRRFYDGDHSYIRNLFQCPESDPVPDHFIRAATLAWLHDRLKLKGPSGMVGFHRVGDLTKYLVGSGHKLETSRDNLLYLLQKGCVVAEHQRTDALQDEDLVRLSPSGTVHLELADELVYLSACAEDVWYADRDAAERVKERIGRKPGAQYRENAVVLNALELATYLQRRLPEGVTVPKEVLGEMTPSDSLEKLLNAITPESLIRNVREMYVSNLPYDVGEAELLAFLAEAGIVAERATLPRADDARKNRGFAFVHIGTTADVIRASFRVDGMSWKGRFLSAHPNLKTRAD